MLTPAMLMEVGMSEVITRIKEAAKHAEKTGAGMWITSRSIQISMRSGFITTMREVSFTELEFDEFNPLTAALDRMAGKLGISTPSPTGEKYDPYTGNP